MIFARLWWSKRSKCATAGARLQRPTVITGVLRKERIPTYKFNTETSRNNRETKAKDSQWTSPKLEIGNFPRLYSCCEHPIRQDRPHRHKPAIEVRLRCFGWSWASRRRSAAKSTTKSCHRVASWTWRFEGFCSRSPRSEISFPRVRLKSIRDNWMIGSTNCDEWNETGSETRV